MVAEEKLRDIPDGFEGAVAGLTLPDVIQMNALNRFSGCITVQYGHAMGMIFLRDGEIIHAEQGEMSGEPAFYEILQWPGGKFNLQPKVTTTSLTIRESWKFLLMEACRLLDENRNRGVVPQRQPERQVGSGAGGGGMSSAITEKLLQVPGVSHSVLLGKDGIAVGDASFEAENLAGLTLYLAMLGNQLGSIFGVGDVKTAAVQGKSSHLLMYESKGHYLSVAVTGDQQLGAVETEIRKVLSPKK
jgi:predicted regulator of Ras-like GTPase activity (Roadblock/LC7/MglB family)